MKLTKEMQTLAKRLRSQGWTVEPSKGRRHLRWVNPRGEVVFSAATPKSTELHAHKSLLRRYGANLEGNG